MVARREYRDRLVALEDQLLRVGDSYRNQLSGAVDLVVAGQPDGVAGIIATDNDLDKVAAGVRDEAIELIALQSPVAGELRLLSAILHVDILVERIGELAVNLSRTANAADPDASDPIMRQLGELGGHTDRLISRALENFARRRVDHADLDTLDDEIDRKRHVIQERAVEQAMTNCDRVDWAIRMSLAATWLERGGDLGLGVARQVPYVVTGGLVP